MKKSELKNLIKECTIEVLSEGARWESENIDKDFYDFYAGLDSAVNMISKFMEYKNAKKDDKAYAMLKGAFKELVGVKTKYRFMGIIDSIAKELKNNNISV